MHELEDRMKAFCFYSKQDLLLSKRYFSNGEEKYSKWIPTSQWDWKQEPTDRLIMPNEIVWETDDPDVKTNKKYTDALSSMLNKFKISHWIYYTGNKSFHIHFVINGLENISDGNYRTQIKKEITNLIVLFKTLSDEIDKNNFNKKKMIRLEGSTNIKTNKKVEKIFQTNYEESEKVTNELLEQAIKIITNRKLNEIKNRGTELLNLTTNNKVYCMLMEHAIKNKLPEGNRHMNLCPNAVAILDNEQLKQLAQTQGMPLSEFEGWSKKKPQFNCVQFRKYGASVGKKDICMECVKNSFHKNNW